MLFEQNNELLLKNHKSRSTGVSPFLEVNVTQSSHSRHDSSCGRGCEHDHGREHGRDCDKYMPYHHDHNHDKKQNNHQKLVDKKNDEKKNHENKS